jgi:hypothetical protein
MVEAIPSLSIYIYPMWHKITKFIYAFGEGDDFLPRAIDKVKAELKTATI